MEQKSSVAGGRELELLLKTMSPALNPGEYVFLSFPDNRYGELAELEPVASFMEQEGMTLVVPKKMADRHQHSYSGTFRCITLQVHSSLEAVGLTATFATQLGKYDISANVIAGFYHDHIFVGADDAEKALEALQLLSSGT